MNRDLANFILIVLFFLLACVFFLLLWSVWPGGLEEEMKEPRYTPQECADQYRAMSDVERGWWDGPEDFIGHCAR